MCVKRWICALNVQRESLPEKFLKSGNGLLVVLPHIFSLQMLPKYNVYRLINKILQFCMN